jgi:hypothetical protein
MEMARWRGVAASIDEAVMFTFLGMGKEVALVMISLKFIVE